MFNINKIIKIVKNGVSHCSSFNLKRLSQTQEMGYEIEDPAAKWIEEEERRQQQQIGVQESYEPSSTYEIPPFVEDRMDRWVSENREELGFEAQNDVETLEKKRISKPGESYISPDFILYKELISNPVYQDRLAEKINIQYPAVSMVKSHLFVGTMLSKTEELLSGMEEQKEKGEPVPLPITEEPPVEEVLKEEPIPKDESIQLAAYERFMVENLSDEEKNRIFGIIGQYDDNMLSKAVESKLGTPGKENYIDQRINFFLKYPKKLKEFSVFEKVPTLENSLREEFRRNGIADDDIIRSLKSVYEKRGVKRNIIDILKRDAGDLLIEIIHELIERADTDVAKWLKGAMVGGEEELGPHYMGTTEDGKARESNLGGLTSSELTRSVITEKDMDETSKKIMAINKYYLKNSLSGIDVISKNVTSTMIDKITSEFSEAELLLEQNPKDLKAIENRNRLMRYYSIAETLNAYSVYAINQINSLFDERGRASNIEKVKGKGYAPSQIKYENRT